MDKDFLMLLSVLLFCAGAYMLLTQRHALLMLLGGELLVQAAALNFIAFGSADAEAQLIVLCLLAVAVAEAVLVLALAFTHHKDTGSLRIDLFDQAEDLPPHA